MNKEREKALNIFGAKVVPKEWKEKLGVNVGEEIAQLLEPFHQPLTLNRLQPHCQANLLEFLYPQEYKSISIRGKVNFSHIKACELDQSLKTLYGIIHEPMLVERTKQGIYEIFRDYEDKRIWRTMLSQIIKERYQPLLIQAWQDPSKLVSYGYIFDRCFRGGSSTKEEQFKSITENILQSIPIEGLRESLGPMIAENLYCLLYYHAGFLAKGQRQETQILSKLTQLFREGNYPIGFTKTTQAEPLRFVTLVK